MAQRHNRAITFNGIKIDGGSFPRRTVTRFLSLLVAGCWMPRDGPLLFLAEEEGTLEMPLSINRETDLSLCG